MAPFVTPDKFTGNYSAEQYWTCPRLLVCSVVCSVCSPAHIEDVLVHRMEEARQLANRKRDDRQKRREKLAAADLRTENRTSN